MDYFPLHMLETITNKFSKDHKVGSGGFGEVYWGVYAGRKIAVKKLNQLQGLDDKEFENEYLNLCKVNHKNVVKLLGYCHESRKKHFEHDGEKFFATEMERIFCFEFLSGGDLEQHIKEDSCDLDWPTCYKIIKGTCQGINHLHTAYEKPILHLDIKPANVLLDNNMNPKIGDLGLSRLATKTLVTTKVQGTHGYMPPEFRNSGLMTITNDVFSLGVLIIKLMDGDHGWARSNEMSNEEFINHVCGNWNNRLKEKPGHTSKETAILQVNKCVEIALECVQYNRHRRPSTRKILDKLEQLGEEITRNPSLASDDDYKDTIIVQGPHSQSSSSLTYSGEKFSSLNFREQILSSSSSGPAHLDVVIVYAFDCYDWSSAWYTVNDGVFWMVQNKLGNYIDCRLGYIYPMTNEYKSDMKPVDPQETKATGYTAFNLRTVACSKNMASGLDEAHKMISNRGYENNGIILLFSDGLINKGDFFDGAEEFDSKVPVHTFTLGGVEYEQGLGAIAEKSPGGMFHTVPVPERPMLSDRFSLLLDSIFDRTTFEDENPPNPSSENQPLDVVLIYAFDCTESTKAWYKMDGTIFWMVQKKLTHLENSCLGYIYPRLTPNDYTSDMKVVVTSDTKANGYTSFARHRLSCTKNMASGLFEAHKMIRNRGYQNGIIMLFSDGLVNKGDFFDGTENFRSEVPVHTFTLDGDAYNQGLQAIAKNSPGGTFNPIPVPDRPDLSAPFSELIDSLLIRRNKAK